jgi:heme ABC exporter ATP-binding subunit CcmA
VSRRFGALWALRGVSLRVTAGEFVLLRGPNGSGKSTLLRVVAGLLRPTAGQIAYTGEPSAQGSAPRERIGFVAHSTLLYDDLTAAENLLFFGQLYSVPDLPQRVEAGLAAAGLAARGKDLVRTFSRGMRQRLSLARALLHSPSLLLLDEPVTGLDQQAFDWLEATLARLHAGGCTILLSVHGDRQPAAATRTLWLDAGRMARDSGGGN